MLRRGVVLRVQSEGFRVTDVGNTTCDKAAQHVRQGSGEKAAWRRLWRCVSVGVKGDGDSMAEECLITSAL